MIFDNKLLWQQRSRLRQHRRSALSFSPWSTPQRRPFSGGFDYTCTSCGSTGDSDLQSSSSPSLERLRNHRWFRRQQLLCSLVQFHWAVDRSSRGSAGPFLVVFGACGTFVCGLLCMSQLQLLIIKARYSGRVFSLVPAHHVLSLVIGFHPVCFCFFSCLWCPCLLGVRDWRPSLLVVYFIILQLGGLHTRCSTYCPVVETMWFGVWRSSCPLLLADMQITCWCFQCSVIPFWCWLWGGLDRVSWTSALLRYTSTRCLLFCSARHLRSVLPLLVVRHFSFRQLHIPWFPYHINDFLLRLPTFIGASFPSS